MIISYDKNFIFVGLPFSACSAISKELIEHYGCDSIMHKHASIPALKKAKPDIDVSAFQIVVVVRDPVEMCITQYHWYKENRRKFYTDSKMFVENGGSVSKRHRRQYQKVNSESLSFEEFLDYGYKFIPYDGLLSENIEYVTKVIRFSNLQEDFKKCFESLGFIVDRELPSHNTTSNKTREYKISERKAKKIFGPFLEYNKKCYGGVESIKLYSMSFWEMASFMLVRKLKAFYRLRVDLKLVGRGLSPID